MNFFSYYDELFECKFLFFKSYVSQIIIRVTHSTRNSIRMFPIITSVISVDLFLRHIFLFVFRAKIESDVTQIFFGALKHFIYNLEAIRTRLPKEAR